MEDAASGSGEALLAKMRALARRGALLHRQTDGAGRIEQTDRKRDEQKLAPQEFIGMLDAGWLRASGADRYVMSRRGASALRSMLTRPASASGARAAEAPAATGLRPQPAVHTMGSSRPVEAPRNPELNPRESPLAWLRQRRDKDGRPMISAVELDAGERLRCDFERAQMGPRVTASWNPAAVPSGQARSAPGVGVEMSDTAVAARQRVDAALAAVGPELAGMLLDVCCFLKGLEQAERNGGWPRRAGKVVLQLGLAHLARHYGLTGQAAGAANNLRSWGAPGYRPAMDAPESDGSEDES